MLRREVTGPEYAAAEPGLRPAQKSLVALDRALGPGGWSWSGPGLKFWSTDRFVTNN